MKRLLLALTLFTGAAANAGSVTCSGTIAYLSFHATDTFMIQLSSMNTPVFFCNPETTFSVTGTSYTTGPNTCKQLYATFLAAKLSGASISGMYFDGDAVPATCSSWGAWQSAVIRHYTL